MNTTSYYNVYMSRKKYQNECNHVKTDTSLDLFLMSPKFWYIQLIFSFMDIDLQTITFFQGTKYFVIITVYHSRNLHLFATLTDGFLSCHCIMPSK